MNILKRYFTIKNKIWIHALIFIVITTLHAIFLVGPFLNLSKIPAWDTLFYFPSFYYFPLVSIFSDVQFSWWSPISQEGIPLYYPLLFLFSPLLPTNIPFFFLSLLTSIVGLNVTVYQTYITIMLLFTPALIIFLTIIISKRLFKNTLTIVFVASLVAFNNYNFIHIYNARKFSDIVMFLFALYTLLLYFQSRTKGSKIFLALFIIFLSLHILSASVLFLLLFVLPLLLIGFALFYYRYSIIIFKDFVNSFGKPALTIFILAIMSAGLASMLIVYLNVDSLVKVVHPAGLDPLMWPTMPGTEIIPKILYKSILNKMLFILPLFIIGLIAGRGRIRFVFFITLLGILFFITPNYVWVIIANAFTSLGTNRHLGDLMNKCGHILVFFISGFGLEAILNQSITRDRKFYIKRAITLFCLLLIIYILYVNNNPHFQNIIIYIWMMVVSLVCLSFFRSYILKYLTTLIVVFVVIITPSWMLYQGSKRIPAHKRYMDYNSVRFTERGRDLQFKMTGNYILENSILTDSRGFLFGEEEGVPPSKLGRYNFSNMTPQALRYIRENLKGTKYSQITGDHIPRIRFPEKIYFVNSKKQALNILQRERQLENIAVLVRTKPSYNNSISEEETFTQTFPKVIIDDFGFNELKLTVTSDTKRYLYYADGYDRFWYAWINGKPTEIYRANIVHKAIKIPEGKSEIVFKFNPWPIKTLYLLTFLFAITFFYHSRKDKNKIMVKD